MNKSIFKKLLITELVLIIITIWKMIFYPYSLAPEDLKNAMIMYDELAPLPDNFVTIMIFIMLIGYFYSILLLFRFRKFGRQLYVATSALTLLFVFSNGYMVFDSFEYLLDSFSLILTGFIISSSYFSKLEKEFK